MSTMKEDSAASDADAAYALIQQASTFSFCNEAMLRAIAGLMTPIVAEDGHVFVREGNLQTEWFILEEGIVERYKQGAAVVLDKEKEDATKKTDFSKDSTLLDQLQGRGRVTALFHSLNENHVSFSSLVAKGPVKLWSVNAQDHRQLLAQHGEFGLLWAAHLANLLRNESKISRVLLAQTRQGERSSSHNPDEKNTGKQRKILKVLCYDSTEWVKTAFIPALKIFNDEMRMLDGQVEIQMEFTEERLNSRSAAYAAGQEAICTFVNDTADEEVIRMLSMLSVKMIAQRAAGFDRIDTKAALTFGLTVSRVPAYSPYAVAEMAISLLMVLNRKITLANSRVKMANFSLDSGLMGMDIHGKTVGVMGTGKIGGILCKILNGYGVNLLCYDVYQNTEVLDLGATYVSQDELYAQSDVIFLMMPLLPATRHTINMQMLSKLKRGVLLINTSRGGLVDTKALLHGLKTGQIAGVGMDVYENETDYFFQDWSARNIEDPELVALLGNNNVVLTAHQAFFTKEAVDKIVSTTLENLRDYAIGKRGVDHPNSCLPTPKK